MIDGVAVLIHIVVAHIGGAHVLTADRTECEAQQGAFAVEHDLFIRSVPGFPKQGIMFRDFMPVFADARGLRILLDALKANLPVGIDDFDAIAGLEARGFLFGPAMAAELGKGFIAVRKAGKLIPCSSSRSLAWYS